MLTTIVGGKIIFSYFDMFLVETTRRQSLLILEKEFGFSS